MGKRLLKAFLPKEQIFAWFSTTHSHQHHGCCNTIFGMLLFSCMDDFCKSAWKVDAFPGLADFPCNWADDQEVQEWTPSPCETTCEIKLMPDLAWRHSRQVKFAEPLSSGAKYTLMIVLCLVKEENKEPLSWKCQAINLDQLPRCAWASGSQWSPGPSRSSNLLCLKLVDLIIKVHFCPLAGMRGKTFL